MAYSHYLSMRAAALTGLVALSVAAPAQRAEAHGGGGDIAVFTTDGRADVGFAILDDDDIDQVFFDPHDKVFQAVLVPLTPTPFIPYRVGSGEPGYDANEGALPPNAELSVTTTGLWRWDGAGALGFTPVVDVTGGYAPSLPNSDPEGGFHSHPTFGLLGPAGDPDLIPSGAYLAELRMSVAGLSDSVPFYMVALMDDVINDATDPVAAAEELGAMVRNYLADPTGAPAPTAGGKDFTFYAQSIAYAESLVVPEPVGAVSMLLGMAGLLAGRRKALR